MRHAEFHIDSNARDEWLGCMREAVADLKIREDLKTKLWEYFEMAAHAMINQPD
jgi:hemoglobin